MFSPQLVGAVMAQMQMQMPYGQSVGPTPSATPMMGPGATPMMGPGATPMMGPGQTPGMSAMPAPGSGGIMAGSQMPQQPQMGSAVPQRPPVPGSAPGQMPPGFRGTAPAQQAPPPPSKAGVGLVFAPNYQGYHVITSLHPAGAARACGRILVGDVIHSVNKKNAKNMPVPVLMSLLQGEPGSKVLLEVLDGTFMYLPPKYCELTRKHVGALGQVPPKMAREQVKKAHVEVPNPPGREP